jgi:hypothetical protein
LIHAVSCRTKSPYRPQSVRAFVVSGCTDGKANILADGGGLAVYVTAKGGRYWRYTYRYEGRKQTLSIGSYPEITLDAAREKHMEARAQLARGTNPATHKRIMKASRTDITTSSFEAIAREWFGRSKASWSESHTARTISYLERDVFPWIGKANINQVTPGDAAITDPVKVGQLLRDMDAYQGSFVVRCALQLSSL